MTPDKCKLKVNLKGESQNVSFEQPVASVEFCDGRGIKTCCLSKFIPGVLAGAFVVGLACFGIFNDWSYYKQEVIRLQYEKIEMQTMLRLKGVKGHLIKPEKPIGDTSAIKPSKLHIRGR